MKMYFITNMYLSPIQRGIQSAHALAELYENNSDSNLEIVSDWAKNHKTIIVLNGGTNESMKRIYSKIEELSLDANLILATFNEPELNNTLTAIALLEHHLPSELYDMLYELKLA